MADEEGKPHDPAERAGTPLESRRGALRLAEKHLEFAHAAGALVGTAAAALAVIGLAGVLPLVLASIGVVLLGVALVYEGAATASRYQRLATLVPVREVEQAQVGGGLTVEVVGGAAGAALGILALVGVEPLVLLPIAAMVFGAAYVMSGGLHPSLETWVERGAAAANGGRAATRREQLTHRAVGAGAAARAIAGIASAMLGILALAGVGPALTLSLASVLTLGLAAMVGASAFSARMSSLSHHP